MSLSVRFTEEGKRTLHELHIGVQKEIKSSLKNLAEDLELGSALVGRLSGFYSLHVGKYRVIYTLEKNNTLMVHYNEHRKDVYGEFEENLDFG